MNAKHPKVLPIQTLALMAANRHLCGERSVLSSRAEVLGSRDPLRPTCYRFGIDGMLCTVLLQPVASGFQCRFAAGVGHILYSIESHHFRRRALEVLRLAPRDEKIGFRVAAEQRVWLTRETLVADDPTPEAVFLETVRFVQVVRPYLRLLRPILGRAS